LKVIPYIDLFQAFYHLKNNFYRKTVYTNINIYQLKINSEKKFFQKDINYYGVNKKRTLKPIFVLRVGYERDTIGLFATLS
jgi:hypothetical protein